MKTYKLYIAILTLLLPIQLFAQTDEYKGWGTTSYVTGITPDCENVSPEYAPELKNYLRIMLAGRQDAIIRLMKIGENGTDVCIRVVYINASESFYMQGIPEDVYYIKVAYGNNYRENIKDGICESRFTENVRYEKSKDLLDFTRLKVKDRIVDGRRHQVWQLPNYETILNMGANKAHDADKRKFNSNEISEKEFYN